MKVSDKRRSQTLKTQGKHPGKKPARAEIQTLLEMTEMFSTGLVKPTRNLELRWNPPSRVPATFCYKCSVTKPLREGMPREVLGHRCCWVPCTAGAGPWGMLQDPGAGEAAHAAGASLVRIRHQEAKPFPPGMSLQCPPKTMLQCQLARRKHLKGLGLFLQSRQDR